PLDSVPLLKRSPRARASIHATTSSYTWPRLPGDISTRLGNFPARTIRQSVLRDTPTRSNTSSMPMNLMCHLLTDEVGHEAHPPALAPQQQAYATQDQTVARCPSPASARRQH